MSIAVTLLAESGGAAIVVRTHPPDQRPRRDDSVKSLKSKKTQTLSLTELDTWFLERVEPN